MFYRLFLFTAKFDFARQHTVPSPIGKSTGMELLIPQSPFLLRSKPASSFLADFMQVRSQGRNPQKQVNCVFSLCRLKPATACTSVYFLVFLSGDLSRFKP